MCSSIIASAHTKITPNALEIKANNIYLTDLCWDTILIPSFWEKPMYPTIQQLLNNDDLVIQGDTVKLLKLCFPRLMTGKFIL